MIFKFQGHEFQISPEGILFWLEKKIGPYDLSSNVVVCVKNNIQLTKWDPTAFFWKH